MAPTNRKIIVSEFISLDGVFEGPGVDESFDRAGWTMPYVNDEFMKFKADELFAADALLLGRVTYDGFAKAWPAMEGTGEFGVKMNGMQKHVVSKTLKKAGWNNSTILKGDIAQEVAELKQRPGKDMLVVGSGVLASTLLRHDLIDEIRLLVYPVVLGSGKRFFKEGDKRLLELSDAKAFKTGVVLLRYRLAANSVRL